MHRIGGHRARTSSLVFFTRRPPTRRLSIRGPSVVEERCISSRDSFSHRAFSAAANARSDRNQDSSVDDASRQPKHVRLELDFFGEPVTFLGHDDESATSNAMAAMDGFLLCAISKGKTCTSGGEEGGLEVQSAHSSAIAWAEALRFAAVWNQAGSVDKASPMLAAVAVAPVLAQTGIAYVKHLDTLLKQAKARAQGLPSIQMYDMAVAAAARKDDSQRFNKREVMHLTALHYLLENEYPTALVTYLRILRSCPGDALALSLAMDLSFTLGDKQAALRYVHVSLCRTW